jgi:sigma-B regulation protein RsbU (phosphoserine phosphatase)
MNTINTDLYNTSPSFLFSFSQKDLLVSSMNATFLYRLGYTLEEVARVKKITDLLTVGSKIFYQTHFAPLLKLHGKFNEIFLSFVSKSNEELPVLLNVVFDETREVFHCGGLQIDQRNRFEKELMEAKKVAEKALLENEMLNHYKSQLELNQAQLEQRLQELSQKNSEHQQINSIISHDLQEPLRKVCMFSDKLLNEDNSTFKEEATIYLRKINNASGKMRELIIHLQRFLSLNEKQVSISSVNLNTALEKAKLKNCGDPVAAASVFFSTDPLPTLQSDPELMVSIFDELISNSIKFRDIEKPDLKISISCELISQNVFKKLEKKYLYADYFRIVYSDNGIGFDPRHVNEIFSIFRKAHAQEGIGIGLSYCKKIMELHQGSITAKGIKGEGAVFTLLFPASLAV